MTLLAERGLPPQVAALQAKLGVGRDEHPPQGALASVCRRPPLLLTIRPLAIIYKSVPN